MVTRLTNDRYSTLINQAIGELRSRTDITQLSPGAKALSLLEIMTRETGNAYIVFDRELAQAFVTYSSGENLDLIGELMGIARLPATRASISSEVQIQKFYVAPIGSTPNPTFGTINSGNSIIIPARTQVSTVSNIPNQETVQYYLAESLTCPSAATEAYATIRSLEYGSAANVGENSLVGHNFENYTDFLNGTLLTTNMESIVQASEEESDDNYRYRLINQTVASESGNAIACRLAALSVPGVADVLMDEFAAGIGTGAVYIKAVTRTVSEQLLVTVQQYLSKVKSFGNLVEARRPLAVGIEVFLTVTLRNQIPADEQEELRQRIRANVYEFLAGLDIGQTLYLNDIIQVVEGTDSNIRQVGELSQPIDAIYIYRWSAAEDNRERGTLYTDYFTRTTERVIPETSIDNPIDITVA